MPVNNEAKEENMNEKTEITDDFQEKKIEITEHFEEKKVEITEPDVRIISMKPKYIFKRKAYDQLKAWKDNSNGSSAILLEGARRVGKTVLAEEFARREYRSYIKIDFSNAGKRMLGLFDELEDLDSFFLRLQAYAGIRLYKRESAIIFDEVQLYPKARQSIKHLVEDGRYDYIETGSLLSLKKNVKGILIPSEEHKISVYPLDYEEFHWALGWDYELLRQCYLSGLPLIESHHKRMREFRLYLSVGGMPQAVSRYLDSFNLQAVDVVKREILSLYEDDFRKIDPSGRVSALYQSIPGELASKRKRLVLSRVLKKKKKSNKDEECFYELLSSKAALSCYELEDPELSLSNSVDLSTYKAYLSDTGLFVSLILHYGPNADKEIYAKLLSDSLNVNLGYVYENAVAQMIVSSGRPLYYHCWRKKDSTHSYEIDFLLSSSKGLVPIEAKSGSNLKHASLDAFLLKYRRRIMKAYLLSSKPRREEKGISYLPFYYLPFILEE